MSDFTAHSWNELKTKLKFTTKATTYPHEVYR